MVGVAGVRVSGRDEIVQRLSQVKAVGKKVAFMFYTGAGAGSDGAARAAADRSQVAPR